MKILQVTMADHSVWHIPAEIVATARARYYAERDVARGDSDDYDQVYGQELLYALADPYELLDWASNSMNWEDVYLYAVLQPPPPITGDYEREWTNAHKEIIET